MTAALLAAFAFLALGADACETGGGDRGGKRDGGGELFGGNGGGGPSGGGGSRGGGSGGGGLGGGGGSGSGGGDGGSGDSDSGGGGGGSDCHPSYEGACLDPYASDYDCEGGSGDGPQYVSGPVSVTGDDPYELDNDGDGIACDT